MALLIVENLKTYFHTRNGVVRAVDGVSFSVDARETLGIVGESGSGKSVTVYSLMGLNPMPPAKLESGTALFDNIDLLHCTKGQLRNIRGRHISMIFQDPMTALNPYMNIGDQIIEPLRREAPRAQQLQRAAAMLESVGITDAARQLRAYPHQFSGGMRQRAMIAMALISHPQLLIADEPTTALDVTVRAQILTIIKRMQQELGMAVILITHNLGVVAGTCDRVLVMYAGKILEAATTRDLFYSSKHPYTKALMDSMPSAREKCESLYTIPGMPPDLSIETQGCPFAPRCAFVKDICRQQSITLKEVAPNHETACTRVQAGEL